MAEDSHAAGAVTLVKHLFQVAAFELAGAVLDRPGDVLLGHADRLGGVDGGAEAEVHVRIAAAAHLRGDDDPLGEPAPELAALGVDQGLFVFDASPVRMT